MNLNREYEADALKGTGERYIRATGEYHRWTKTLAIAENDLAEKRAELTAEYIAANEGMPGKNEAERKALLEAYLGERTEGLVKQTLKPRREILNAKCEYDIRKAEHQIQAELVSTVLRSDEIDARIIRASTDAHLVCLGSEI